MAYPVGAVVAVRVIRHQALNLSWKLIFGFLGQVYVAILAGVLIAFGTVVRRWTVYTNDRVRWRLDVKPLVVGGVYIVAFTATPVWVGLDAGFVLGGYIGG